MESTNNTFLADGFEDAVIGVFVDGDTPRVVYSKALMETILINRDGMSMEDAIEYLEYNVYSTYLGEGTPIYIEKLGYSEVMEYIKNYNS